MRFSTKLLCAVASAALAPATPAAAQTVTRIVAFGDSYADDGNLFQLLGVAPPAVYPTGRFSGGTNFIDTMSLLLNAPVDNFAIGGAFTNNGNINGPGIPGFVTEYSSFLAGGGPAAFPRVTGTFGPNDLLAISIGGNDARAYERSLGLTPTSAQVATLLAGAPGQANLRVAEATTGLNALVAAGARNITFLAGDVGRLPEVSGLSIAAVGSAYASAFNTGIQSSLSNIAAQGVIVNYLDLNLIGDRVIANPGAYGLTSAGACPVACASSPELARQYLFYVDQLHLTSAGFEIVAHYAVRQLEAPLHFQSQSDIGLETGNTFASTLQGRLNLSNARIGTGGAGQGLHAFLTGDVGRRAIGRTLTNLDYDLNTIGATGGVEYEMGGAVIGTALNYTRGTADIGTGKTKARNVQLGLYGGWSGGGAFVEGYAGYGWIDYDLRRDGVIDEISGDTSGQSMIAGGRAGYLIGTNGLRVGPVIGLDYAKADLDAYTETGDAVLTLNVGDQSVKALTGSLGVEARGNFNADAFAIQPYASLTAEKDLEGDSRTIRYSGTASPTIVNSFVLPDRSKDLYGRVSAGASIGLPGAASLQVHGSTTIDREGGNDLSAFVGVKLGF